MYWTPKVAGVKLTKVLIDTRSVLNVLFMSTLKNVGLDITKMLTSTRAPFYGVIPGNTTISLGQVVLQVTFETREYKTGYLKFEVENFEISNHTILGRPNLKKFMAVPHYLYLLLKMPRTHGVLTPHDNLKNSYNYDQDGQTRRPSNTPQPHVC